jgi:hypothetical protein
VRVSLTDGITTAISLAALVFLGAQVMLARKSLREAAEGQEREWDRQRRKATIDASVVTAEYRETLKSPTTLERQRPRGDGGLP